MTRRAGLTGISTNAPGSGAVTQYSSGAEIIRMPSGSIVSIPSLEPLHLAEARLKEALLFALPLSIILWILIGLAIWGLISAVR
jgi:hypothetical protein